MRGLRQRRVHRLRAVAPQPAGRETAASLLPGAPRVAALDALLRDVDTLRRGLDLGLAATADAVQAGALAGAVRHIDAERSALGAFEHRALAQLAELATAPARRPRRMLPAAPFVAAAALLGFVGGAGPAQLGGEARSPQSVNAATSSWVRLTELAADGGSASQMRDAALALHTQLGPLIARAADDPAAAQQALALLRDEQGVLAASGDRVLLLDVLRQSQTLSRTLAAALPGQVRRLPGAGQVLVASPRPHPAAATPAPAPAQPAPTSSPAATRSPDARPSPTGTTAPPPASLPPSLDGW